MEKPRRNLISIVLFLLVTWSHIKNASSKKSFPQSPRYVGNDMPDLADFNKFAEPYKTLNFGMGFPNFNTLPYLKEALVNVTQAPGSMLYDQYTDLGGHGRLVNILAKTYSGLVNHKLDPKKNVIVTVGGTEALSIAIDSLTFPGDEWIVFDPHFVLYLPIIRIAEGVIRFAHLKPTKTSGVVTSSDWAFDRDEFAKLFNSKTKGILLNNPHNPSGKVFSRDDLQFIADLAIKHDVVVIADEVFEWLIYEPTVQHVRIATLPGMFERTITIGSASKTFSASGWRIGWAYGPTKLISYMSEANENSVTCNTTPLQEAFARLLEHVYEEMGQPDSDLIQIPKQLKAKRDAVVETYRKIGMTPFVPDSGIVVLTNWTGINNRPNLDLMQDRYNDIRFSKWMIKNLGIEVYPASLFYSDENKNVGQDLIRTCFTKTDDMLEEFDTILSKYASEGTCSGSLLPNCI